MATTSRTFPEREQLLDQVVVAYLEAVESGQPPDDQCWFARYPQLRSELGGFLADQEKVIRWTEPLRMLGKAAIAVDDPYGTMNEDTGQPAGMSSTSLGNYELLDEIARGGMGVVYKARQLRLNRVVALKMIPAGQLATRAEVQRFRTEAEAVASLDHANIMPIYDVGEYEGRPYFSMKLIEGGSLAQHLTRFGGDQRAAARLLALVARAVHHAHQRGILHRDLKPANILLDAQWQPYVTDFGLARRVQGDSGVTQSGAVVGTPSYMAPEQAAGRKGLTTAADVYSLGAILYAILTDRPPFRADTPLETVRQVVEEEPSRPRLLNPRVERDLETICLKCLQKEPQRRYGSAEALADDLERWLAGEPIHARRSTAWERVSKRVKRNPAATALVVVMGLALLGAIVGGLLYQEQRARLAEQKLSEHRRVTDLRWETLNVVDAANEHLARGELQDAKVLLVEALAKSTAERSLDDLTTRAQELLAETDRKLGELQARRDAQNKYEQFFRDRDEVLFHGSQFTGVDLPTNLETTRRAGQQALSLFGLTMDGDGVMTLDPSFTDRERDHVTSGCYELLLILAEAAAQQDPPQVEQALRLLASALELGGPSKAYHLRHARSLERLGDRAGAEKEHERAASLQPSSALDFFLLGEDLRRHGNPRAAIREFENALRVQPNHFWARYLLAVCLVQNREYRAAKAHLTACLSERPDFAWSYLHRGFAHGKLSEFQAAEVDFEKAMDHSSRVPWRGDELRYAALVNRGVLRTEQGRFEEGVADLQQAIALTPDEYQAYWNLANTYRQVGQLDAAIEQLDRAIERAQRKVMGSELEQSVLSLLYNNRVNLHLERQDWEGTLADVDQGLRVTPFAEGYVVRGRVLYRQGKYQEAVAAYDDALRVAPANPGAYNRAETYRWRAEALLKLEQYREAAHSIDGYLTLGGQPNVDVYRLRGLSRAKLGDFSQAIHDYTQALTLKSNDSETFALRGWVYFVRDAPKLALEDFDQAIRFDRKNGDAYNGRGYVHVKLGNAERAVDDVEEALRRGPETARMLWNAARVYGQAVSLLDTDPRRQSLNDSTARRQYHDRAVELLGKSLAATPANERASFWRNYIQPDAADSSGALYPLRHSPEFVRLATENAQTAK